MTIHLAKIRSPKNDFAANLCARVDTLLLVQYVLYLLMILSGWTSGIWSISDEGRITDFASGLNGIHLCRPDDA